MRTESQNNQAHAPNPAVVSAALRGLHDMAQPLTVLQGSLELALMQVQSIDEYRQWLEFALEQAGRLASNLEYVQQVVRLQHPPGDVEIFPVSAPIRASLQELQSSFAERQAVVTVIRRGEREELAASFSRVHEILRLMFSGLCSLLPQCGQIILEIDSAPTGVVLQFRVADERGQAIELQSNASIPSCLKLAQAAVASASGEMTIAVKPLRAEIFLPSPKSENSHKKVRKGTPLHV